MSDMWSIRVPHIPLRPWDRTLSTGCSPISARFMLGGFQPLLVSSRRCMRYAASIQVYPVSELFLDEVAVGAQKRCESRIESSQGWSRVIYISGFFFGRVVIS